jgi:hypothetical protein
VVEELPLLVLDAVVREFFFLCPVEYSIFVGNNFHHSCAAEILKNGITACPYCQADLQVIYSDEDIKRLESIVSQLEDFDLMLAHQIGADIDSIKEKIVGLKRNAASIKEAATDISKLEISHDNISNVEEHSQKHQNDHTAKAEYSNSVEALLTNLGELPVEGAKKLFGAYTGLPEFMEDLKCNKSCRIAHSRLMKSISSFSVEKASRIATIAEDCIGLLESQNKAVQSLGQSFKATSEISGIVLQKRTELGTLRNDIASVTSVTTLVQQNAEEN